MQDLDYTLTTSQRIAYLDQLAQDGTLATLKPAQIEFLTNWALHEDKHTTSIRNTHTVLTPTLHKPESRLSSLKASKTVSSDALHPNEVEHARKQDTTRYIAPPKPINYKHPNLLPFKEGIDILNELIDNSDGPDSWKLTKWRTELRLDAGIRWHSTLSTINVSPSPNIPVPPSLDAVDMGDSFHIKHIIENYTKLRQDGCMDTQYLMDYFERIVDTAPLKSWQYDIIKLKCEGTKGIIIAKHMWEDHQKNFTPQSLSNTLRSLYRIIAEWATQFELEWEDRNDKSKWRKCTKCGAIKHNSTYNFHKGRNECKVCRATERKTKINQPRTEVPHV